MHSQTPLRREGVRVAGPNILRHAEVDDQVPVVDKGATAPNDGSTWHGKGDASGNTAIGKLKIAVCRRYYGPIRIARYG
jgi:hypothetical protein